MNANDLEIVSGTGNDFHELGVKHADVEQFKALLAVEIIKTLDRESLSVRQAHARTGIAAADFSRLRSSDLSRFTADRLIAILSRLGSKVEISLKIRRGGAARRLMIRR